MDIKFREFVEWQEYNDLKVIIENLSSNDIWWRPHIIDPIIEPLMIRFYHLMSLRNTIMIEPTR